MKTEAYLARKIFLWLLLLALVLVVFFWLEKDVVIYVDGKMIKTKTFTSTVKDVLREKSVVLGPKDRVEPELDAKLKDDMKIRVIRAFPVEILADGKKSLVVLPPVTVREALSEAGIAVRPKDIITPALTSLTKPGQEIRVVRVEEKIAEQKVSIPFRKQTISDHTLEKGLYRTLRRGKPGLAWETVKITYHDGKAVKREVLNYKVVRAPEDQVVAMGTITSVSRGGLRLNFEQALMVVATAYTFTGRRTATGLAPEVGMVAVDPRVIPLGARLYIEGYGFAKASDRGSGIQGNEIDVFLETKEQCRSWGRRTVKVYVLK